VGKKSFVIVGFILVLAFVGLRVYGAYERERETALQRAAIADEKAHELNAESERLKR